MFKRVEKRRRKKEEEEELGLDDDMKDVLGMQDTDSDESNSESEDSDSEAGDEVGSNAGSGAEGEDGEESEEEEDESEAENPEISVQDALDDPVYLVSLDPDVKACIVCPGKLLKNAKMIDVHMISGVCTFDLPNSILKLICDRLGS